MITIVRETSNHQDFRQLVGLLDAYLNARYGALQAEYDQHNSVCFEKPLPSKEDAVNACEIVIKSVPQIRAVAVRVSSDQAYEPLFEQARAQVATFAADHSLQATGPLMGIYYEDPTDPDCACDFAVAFPTNSQVEADETIQVLVLPAVDTMATNILPGDCSPDETDKAYESIIAWIKANHYQIDGPYREIFYASREGQNMSEPMIEVQFPVKSTS